MGNFTNVRPIPSDQFTNVHTLDNKPPEAAPVEPTATLGGTGFEDVSTARAPGAIGAAQEAGAGVAIGIGREALRTLTGIPEVIRPGSTGGLGEVARTEPAGLAEQVGGLAEQALEFAGGAKLLKGAATLARVHRAIPEALAIAEKYPKGSKILLGALEAGEVGAAQAGVKAPARGEEPAKAAVIGGAGAALGGAAGETLGQAVDTKTLRAMINRSLGAGARDVTYGDPARAIINEGIINPKTGDFKELSPGGRLEAVTKRMGELKRELDGVVGAAKNRFVSVKEAIFNPAYEKGKELITNRAMTAAEKDAAWAKISDMITALTEGFPERITPAEALDLKRQLGDRINWGGTVAVTDEVKPFFRALYASLRDVVHRAVPEAATLDARLTDLHAAYDALFDLSKREAIGAGRGLEAANFLDSVQRIVAEIGRVLPAGRAAALSAPGRAAASLAGEQTALTAGRDKRQTDADVLPALQPGFTRFTASDGSVHDVPTENLERARAIDPGLQVHT